MAVINKRIEQLEERMSLSEGQIKELQSIFLTVQNTAERLKRMEDSWETHKRICPSPLLESPGTMDSNQRPSFWKRLKQSLNKRKSEENRSHEEEK